MPGHRVHRYADRKLFGKVYYQVHVKMDLPWIVLGNKHRVLFHDWLSVVAIAKECYPFDKNAQKAAVFHILLDRLGSGDPLFHERLKFLAKRDLAERQRIKLWEKQEKKNAKMAAGIAPPKGSGKRKKTEDPGKEFEKFLKKAMQIEAMCRELF